MRDNLDQVLKDFFHLESFREGQKEIIESIIEKNDTLVFMPTGWGKSLTYQLPGVVFDGVCIVISPLISLMKDQVDALWELWIKARCINSTITANEIENILSELVSHSQNPIKFLYIAPERLHSHKFREAIQQIKISLIAIDEAHCISQWWHDFRPSYMKISDFISWLKEKSDNSFPVVWLTATATEKVRADIAERLSFKDHKIFISGFDRKNIILVVREISKKSEKSAKVLEILQKTPGSGIIYCSSRKAVKEIYDDLQSEGVAVGMYTGEMTPENREHMQNTFMNDGYKVIVATNAFGMGIDKKDIRFVIHYNLPGSIENYYQEVWRWGRDGGRSFGIVLASYGDTKIQEFFIENTYPEKSEILEFYSYLFKDLKVWEGKHTQILKTYYVMASESGLANDMKVGSIVKILEKYGIIQRWYSWDTEGFRGRWITLIQDKRAHNTLLIDWRRQESLKNEAYFKLEEMKKLLFFPHCRKRYILEYFWDREDAATLWENCKACDYCLEWRKVSEHDVSELLPVSVYAIVLETIKKFDEKFWQQLFVKFLSGSQDKRIFEWNLDTSQFYGALKEYSSEWVSAIIESLIYEWYLFRQSGKYPLVWITELWEAVIYRDKQLKENLETLNQLVVSKAWVGIVKSSSEKSSKNNKNWKKTSVARDETYKETLALFQSWTPVKDIVEKRWLTLMTIENHIIKLYEGSDISLMEILKIAELQKIKCIKQVFIDNFPKGSDKLKPIMDAIENAWKKNISYFEIKLTLAMIEKGDI